MSSSQIRSTGGYSRSTDKLMLLICIVISSFSCLLMASLYENGFAASRIIIMQSVATVIGVVASILVSLLDYHKVVKLWPLYAVLAVGLVLALKIPEISYMPEGSDDAAWLRVAGLSLQPSEILKLAFVYTFALHLSKVRHKINTLKTFLLLCLHGAVPTFLIMDTGDYGSALVFVAIFAAMMFVAGLSWRFILVGLTAALAAVPVVWMMLPHYLQQRFLIAWHPETDIENIGYQQYWGQQALRAGGVFGKGLFGHQENLIDVPECYNDFIFSYIGQTLGFVGCTVTVVLLAVLMAKILQTARKSKDDLGVYICTGVFAIFLFQSIINIGMVLCVIPVVGVTLPFVSSGGTSLVISYVAVGMVLGVHRANCR